MSPRLSDSEVPQLCRRFSMLVCSKMFDYRIYTPLHQPVILLCLFFLWFLLFLIALFFFLLVYSFPLCLLCRFLCLSSARIIPSSVRLFLSRYVFLRVVVVLDTRFLLLFSFLFLLRGRFSLSHSHIVFNGSFSFHSHLSTCLLQLSVCLFPFPSQSLSTFSPIASRCPSVVLWLSVYLSVCL